MTIVRQSSANSQPLPSETALDVNRLVERIGAELQGLLGVALKNDGVLPGAEMIFARMAKEYPGTSAKQHKKDFDALLKLELQRRKKPKEPEEVNAPKPKRDLTELEIARAVEFGSGAVYAQYNDLLRRTGCYLSDPAFGNCLLNIIASTMLPYGTCYGIRGSSSSGKSYCLGLAFKTLPQAEDVGRELVIDMTSQSKQVLAYIGSVINIKHTILYFGELEDEENTHVAQQRRQLQDGKTKRFTLDRVSQNGPQTVKIVTTEGPCVQVFATTKDPGEGRHENHNREHTIWTDDTPQGTAGKLALQAQLDAAPWLQEDPQLQEDLETFRLFWLSLNPYPVWIWYAHLICPKGEDVEQLLPTDARLYRHLKTFVACSALLSQHKRDKININGVDYLVPVMEDYLMADRLLRATAPKTLETLPANAERAFQKAKKKLVPGEFYTRSEITTAMRQPHETVKTWLPRLVDADYLKLSDEKRGRAFLYQLGTEKGAFHETLNLVTPDSLTPEMFSAAYTDALVKVSQVQSLPEAPTPLLIPERTNGEGNKRSDHA